MAEGDTGLNGKKSAKKLRFTNSDLEIIRFFINWLKKYFPRISYYVCVILPQSQEIKNKFSVPVVKKFLGLRHSQIRLQKGAYNKKVKYRVCADFILLINLVLKLERLVKKLCLTNNNLASAYIRGMMAGEGTCYFNKSRYVRIEMKNKREIAYIYKLLRLLNYECKLSSRTYRKDMWSIFIGAKQLKKFYSQIGFGAHKQRQKIL
ncbi:MAG: LAGLIDADG family homing endonuclease, partial [Elusimicrobiota bacterium]